MLARYCLVALVALVVIVETAVPRSRGRRTDIRYSNKYTPKYKDSRATSRANFSPKTRISKSANRVRVNSKDTELDNAQSFRLSRNRLDRSENNNSGLASNNFSKSRIDRTSNRNNIQAIDHANASDNVQTSTQRVSNRGAHLSGNLQPNGGSLFPLGGGFWGGSVDQEPSVESEEAQEVFSADEETVDFTETE